MNSRHFTSSNSTSIKQYFTMDDQQKRIKRPHNALFQQSQSQSDLFSKGVKKIEHSSKETSVELERGIRRSYHNKQTYNISQPNQKNTNEQAVQGGVRKIYLYDQRKQSNPLRNSSRSGKKLTVQTNRESKCQNTDIFLINKLITNDANCQWHNKLTIAKFVKKENIVNSQNLNKESKVKEKASFKQGKSNVSSLTGQSGCLTLRKQRTGEKIDFDQNYYGKYSRLGESTSRYNSRR